MILGIILYGRVVASSTGWAEIEGDFHLETNWEKVVFYVEGPPPLVDLLLDSAQIRPSLPGVGFSASALGGRQPYSVKVNYFVPVFLQFGSLPCHFDILLFLSLGYR